MKKQRLLPSVSADELRCQNAKRGCWILLRLRPRLLPAAAAAAR
eukprot:COSAG01_NODE_62353_length_285_cov_0.672043_1_plen_43_part_01